MATGISFRSAASGAAHDTAWPERLLAMRHPYALLTVLCLLLWLPGFFTLPPSDRDESRFAQASKQMIETGDYVQIRNGTVARNQKPIGIYWLQVPFAAAAHAADLARANPIWPYRMPSLLGGLIAVLATFAAGRGLVGERAALLGAGMLAASLLLVTETHIAKTDAALLGATCVAMGVLGRAWMTASLSAGAASLFWVALGASILLKGPVAPMVVALAIAWIAATAPLAGRPRVAWLRTLRPGWGALLLVLMVLPWFVAIGVATHGAFFRQSVGGDLGGKLAGGDDAHGAPPGFHLLLLALTLFPASAVVLRALPAAWRERRDPAVLFLTAWAVPSWLVFEAVPTKLPHYVLPLFPALCLFGARWAMAARPAGRGWLSRGLFCAAALVLGVAAAALPIVVEPGWAWTEWLGIPGLLACGLVAWLVMRAGTPTRAALTGIVAMPLVTWTLLGAELPNLSALWPAPRVAAALRAHGPNNGFAAAGYAEPSLMFLCGTDTVLLADGAAAADYLHAAPGRVVLVEGRDMADFSAQAARVGDAPKRFAVIDGFNYSRGRRVTLALFQN